MKSLIALIIMLPCLLIFCTGKNQPAVPEVTIRLDVREGQTVFELLEAQHEVEYDRTSMGIFVKAIDGIKNEKGHYWIYYLNGQPGRVACDKATVFDGDTVVWKYSKSGS